MTNKGIDSREPRTRADGPYDMALIVTFGDKNEEGKAKAIIATTSVKKGTDPGDAAAALSGGCVQLLMDLAGPKKKRRAKILAAYMERFVNTATGMAGEGVMDMAAERMSGERKGPGN